MLDFLSIRNVRNIKALECRLSPTVNCFYGENGSGKSSILEAIHFLSLGRSFRTRLVSRVISHEATSLTVFSKTHFGQVGLEKDRKGSTQVRVNNETVTSIAELATLLPLQLIEPHSYRILEGAPKQRRQLLDWGVFHVEHLFLSLWREAQRAIKHRNAAIRQGLSKQQITLWNPEIIRLAEELTTLRESYLDQYLQSFKEVLEQLSTLDIELKFYPGWNQEKGLEEVLEQSLERDRQLGYTQFGPHRADLKIKHNNVNAVDILSRGQQKLLVLAISIAQGLCLHSINGKQSVYLIDDIAAELDPQTSGSIMDFLYKIKSQVILTSVSPEFVEKIVKNEAEMFKIQAGELVGAG
jgi:DNA replication and repair protein RecF